MTNSADRRPFSMPYVQHTGNVIQATPTMIARAPWPAPVNKYFVLRKLVASFSPGTTTSGGTMGIWDQDLSNTTPVARGSGGGPLFTVPLVPTTLMSGIAPSMIILDIDACPQEMFQAGVCVQTAVSGVVGVSFEADVV